MGGAGAGNVALINGGRTVLLRVRFAPSPKRCIGGAVAGPENATFVFVQDVADPYRSPGFRGLLLRSRFGITFGQPTVAFMHVSHHPRISVDPDVMFGKPVIRNTRVPVELILRKLGGGLTPEQILAAHPRLKGEAILAAQTYAADLVAGEDIAFADRRPSGS